MPRSSSARRTRSKLPQLQLILRELEDAGIPRFLFLNKIDRAEKRVRETLATLQPASRVPLVLRQIPIWKGELIAGFVDLALERAFVYREHMPSEVVELEGGDLDREKEARFSMLEKLADHDDALMEQLLEDIQPPRDAVFDDLSRELREGLICPVLLGSATRANGVLRLLKALRHEAPGVAETAERLKVENGAGTLAYVFKTHACAAWRQDVVRARCCPASSTDGATLLSQRGERGPLLQHLGVDGRPGQQAWRRQGRRRRRARQARSRQHRRHADSGKTRARGAVRGRPRARRCWRCRVAAADRKDDVKLGQSLLRLGEEDPSLTIVHNPRHPRGRAVGAGRNAPARRARAAARALWRQRQPAYAGGRLSRNHPQVDRPSADGTRSSPAATASSATWCWRSRRCRAARASSSTRRWSAARCRATTSARWRRACVDALLHGPLGFPVVDIAVTLTDGSYHTVELLRSRLPYRGADRRHEALPECQPVLLEPIHTVEIVCPTDATAKINAILSGRRGQILVVRHPRRLAGLGRACAPCCRRPRSAT